ncbi:MAG: hypothetical protein M1818_006176 [Claussenomyces sp. TS43310]|nr:MAG: hypothetical protein M1818_006176 [Claussenomyces sp. TS43310]
MGMWPFRRKSSRRRLNRPPKLSTSPEMVHHAAAIERHNAQEVSTAQKSGAKGVGEGKRGSRTQKKLQRDPERRAYSFSPGRNDTIRVPKDVHRQHPVPPLPPADAFTNSHTWNSGAMIEKNKNVHEAGTTEWQRVPTLHKRAAQDLPRRKSSKKRKEDHDREAEIKAMSSSMPTRPATYDGLAGRPMKRESKRLRDGLNRNFTNPSSDISLPSPESLHSSTSSDADRHASYRLKGMFSPHPTIKYSENPRTGLGAGAIGAGVLGVENPDSQHNSTNRNAIPEETLKAKKRIEDLADDLSARDLRELMERDQRRRDRKKALDQQKMERKLARRAERQKAAEVEASSNGQAPPENMDRGVLGRELVGLGIEAGAMSSPKRKISDASSRRRGKRPADVGNDPSNTSPNPFEDFHRSDSLAPTEAGTPVDEGKEEAIIATAKLARLSRASLSPPTSPKGHTRGASSISQIIELNKSTPPVPTPPVPPIPDKSVARRMSSDASLPYQSSWTSFFKRSSRSKRGSIPSSFSNTSRESALATAQAASRALQPYEFSKSTSNLPKRTMSKFREDLPDFPISPPDSRIQSPEADEVPPIQTGYPEKKNGGRGSIDNPSIDAASRRHDTPTSGYRSLEAASRLRNETPTSGHRSFDVPSPEPTALMSQSLASVDSEGSWLSGKPRSDSKRGSVQTYPHPLRNSASSLERRYKEFAESAEELGIAEDEYFSRLTPGADEMFNKTDAHRRISGNPVASSDEEDGESIASPRTSLTKWGAVGRQPTVVHHQTRAKSREGLLNDYSIDSEDESPETSPVTMKEILVATEDEEGSVAHDLQRATSISLGRNHARHISAGSAKLLDVKPRASGEARRRSSERRGSAH